MGPSSGEEVVIRPKLSPHFFRTSTGIAVLSITAIMLLWALFAALRPLPGRDVSIAIGTAGSAYANIAGRYREILARDGVRLHLVPTNGAVENLERLRDARAGVDAGFVLGGTTSEQESPDLVSLGTVFYEPLWVFSRYSTLADLLHERPNARMSIGPLGSATRPLVLKLFALNRLETTNLQLSGFSQQEGVRRLIAGEIDADAMLSAWDSPAVQQLLVAPGIKLMGFERADAYVALYPRLSKLVLPQGVADLGANRPPADVPLIASKASLVVRRDLHPALQYLLIQAAIEVHGRPGIFQRADEFPAPEAIDLPLSDEARHLYKSGPSILQRKLPFWLAELLQRLAIIILPLAGILYPLWFLLPGLYRRHMENRLYRFYGELGFIEGALQKCTDAQERAQMLARVEELERRAIALEMPRSYSEKRFNLRAHIRALMASARRDA
jgi:TRAP-type uncharacterized transport system substrate-binding protein